MCGIWGFIGSNNENSLHKVEVLFKDIFLLSESRGKEACGITLYNKGEKTHLKRPISATRLVRDPEYHRFISKYLQKEPVIVTAIGHSRLVTNGSEESNDNNQPISSGDVTTVHNGIIVNTNEILQKYAQIQPVGSVDTEVFVQLLEVCLQEKTRVEAFRSVYSKIFGMASTLNIFSQGSFVAATNNGSLYYCFSNNHKNFIFASERNILNSLISKNTLAATLFQVSNIQQLYANSAVEINMHTLKTNFFSLPPSSFHLQTAFSRTEPVLINKKQYAKFEIDEGPIRKLRRCTKCVLPETMPFIQFDTEVVCNYCRTYKKQSPYEEKTLYAWAESQKKPKGQADSIVSFSGGRDSSYGLHYFVKELGLNPVAYSYDWGMVTDLARRNQSRMCAALGVELITINADIKKKRRNIQKNVLAWLKNPDLGMVPLFMAGDKQFFYYANKVRKDYRLETVLMAVNPLEKTFFKTGFCGVCSSILRNGEDSLELEQLKKMDIIQMMGHYAFQFLKNPSYINLSLVDTIGATFSYYAIPHNYMRLFNHMLWEENVVDDVLIGQYDWEISSDSLSTWRIGDGTAPFYNYIYYLIAGLTENDTLRSNQIREGALDRKIALDLVYRDNRPRFHSMQWYFDAIGLDLETVLKRVQEIPKLYTV